MRRRILLSVSLLVAGWGAIVVGPVGQAQDLARIRLVGALPVNEMFDMSLNDTGLFEGLEYGDVGPYEAVEAGEYALVISIHGSGEPVLEGDIDLAADTYYTMVVTGTADEVEGLLVEDDLTAPDPGLAHLRLAHVSAFLDPVDLLGADGSPVVEAVGYGDLSESLAFEAGLHDLAIVDSATGEELLALSDLELADGHVYSAFLMGIADDEPGVMVVLSVDAVPAGPEAFTLFLPALRRGQ